MAARLPSVSLSPFLPCPAVSFSYLTDPFRPMLRPANVVDLPILRALIREGALNGSFDRDLATESREALLFFSNLRQALASGYFVEEDPRTGDLATVSVPGYVYLPDGFKDAMAYLVLIGVLILWPRGLLGEAHGRRV